MSAEIPQIPKNETTNDETIRINTSETASRRTGRESGLILLPEISDAEKIGYTPEQITWCQENESYMWRYFMQEQLLYSSDSKLPSRFINTAPFSKFYLEIDNESPGRVGTWIGWQIVLSFMKNNDVNLQQLLQMDPIEIFQNSKYKPKK